MKKINIFDSLEQQLTKIAATVNPSENENMALEGQTNLINSGNKNRVDMVPPTDIKEGLDNKKPTREEEGGNMALEGQTNLINSGKKISIDIVAPKSEKDEIKKIAKELEDAVIAYAIEAEKTAGIKVSITEDSALYKAAAALKGAVRIIDAMENESKLASFARDFLDHNLAENYEDSLKIIKSAHEKLNCDISAVETWMNNQKLAYSLNMSSGLSENIIKENTAYENMENFMRG